METVGSGRLVGDDADIGRAILREAHRHPLLERDEERDLARRAGAGDGDATRRLVCSHLRVVIKMARPYRRLGLPMSDLLQEGTLGLLQAVRRFDPSRGVRLSTYAMWWIRASIQDYVRRSWSMVRGGTPGWSRRRSAAGETDDDGAAADGVAADTATSPARTLVARMGACTSGMAAGMAARARRLVSFDRSVGAETAVTVGVVADPPLEALASEAPTPEQWLAAVSQQRFARATIAAALESLPPRERFVIRQRYFADVRPTFAAIGRELGVSKDRVRQLEAKALDQLREHLGPVAADLT
jgi:RNA polymerase sigma-32 factor